jgi:hypothetical protein
MYYTPEDIRARNAFLDNVIGRTADFFSQNRGASVQLFDQKFSLDKLLGQSTVPNFRHGVVDMPEAVVESEAFPVIAAHTGEEITLGSSFLTQTPTQREHTLTQMALWGPAQSSPGEIIGDMIVSHSAVASTSKVKIQKGSGALTSAQGLVWDLDVSRQHKAYSNLPPGRIGKLLLRPLLVLDMDTPTKVENDVIAHELVHVIQKVENPLRTISSQKRADMQALREELEAYHVGALTRMRMEGIASIKDITQNDIFRSPQLAVEAVRTITNDHIDPFRPSPALLKRLQQLEYGHILHNNLPFDQIVASLDSLQ